MLFHSHRGLSYDFSITKRSHLIGQTKAMNVGARTVQELAICIWSLQSAANCIVKCRTSDRNEQHKWSLAWRSQEPAGRSP